MKRRRKIDMVLQIEAIHWILQARTVRLADGDRWPSCIEKSVSVETGPFDSITRAQHLLKDMNQRSPRRAIRHLNLESLG